jgi:hypothetical protein
LGGLGGGCGYCEGKDSCKGKALHGIHVT